MQYPKEFKEKAIKKVLSNRGVKTTQEIAKELGMPKATLYKWMSKSTVSPIPKEGSFSPSEQLQILKETYQLDSEALSAYCRKKGIFEHQLKGFEQSLVAHKPLSTSASKQELEEERAKNKQLAKELRRKEKALAEAAALLVLQKKFQALFQDEE
ncbi:transposase [Sulfurimonas sp. SAG-AH-194-I05]|nr:transposase [Sulfurimonas sp. SAG-AH-194-I05]MDF1875934.1 transposase [Sulfurimonas sp. SAG-AH-194-I05]